MTEPEQKEVLKKVLQKLNQILTETGYGVIEIQVQSGTVTEIRYKISEKVKL